MPHRADAPFQICSKRSLPSPEAVMHTPPASSATPAETIERLTSTCRALRGHLDRVRRAVDAEIATYPTPIPRCDAQFNHLYEQRSRLVPVLARLDDALGSAPEMRGLAGVLLEFSRHDPFEDSTVERQLRQRARDALSLSGVILGATRSDPKTG